jgi:nucleoside diphosphate kinase
MISGDSHVVLVEANRALARHNELCGHNNPTLAGQATLRHRYGTSLMANAVHATRDAAEYAAHLDLFELADG